MEDIINFLKYGSLLDVKIGSSLDDVFNVMGEAEDSVKNGSLILYKFGSIEVTFQENVVCIINLEVFENEFYMAGKSYTMFDSVEDITEALDTHNVGWRICTERSYDTTLALVCESESVIYFGFPKDGVTKIQNSSLGKKFYKY